MRASWTLQMEFQWPGFNTVVMVTLCWSGNNLSSFSLTGRQFRVMLSSDPVPWWVMKAPLCTHVWDSLQLLPLGPDKNPLHLPSNQAVCTFRWSIFSKWTSLWKKLRKITNTHFLDIWKGWQLSPNPPLPGVTRTKPRYEVDNACSSSVLGRGCEKCFFFS